MVAIVSGNGLGLQNSSLALLGKDESVGNAVVGRDGDQAFMNAATGNLVLQKRDEILIGKGQDIDLFRTYNSLGQTGYDNDNNDNWRVSAYKRVFGNTGTANGAGSTISRLDSDGTETLFNYDVATGKYISTYDSGANDTLTAIPSVTWTWVDGNTGMTEVYDTVGSANQGRLKEIIDPDGNRQAFTDRNARIYPVVERSSAGEALLDVSTRNLTFRCPDQSTTTCNP
jgi:hypothetical protein